MTVAVKPESLRPSDDKEAGGVKADHGKTRYELVPPEGIEAVAYILSFGAAKYGDRNWEKGMAWSRPFGACLRHLYAWWSGEDKDPDTGKSHLWHAACNVFFLLAYERRGIGRDDRNKISGQS
jgi:hypothetical protein